MARWRALAGLVATGVLVGGMSTAWVFAPARAPGALASVRVARASVHILTLSYTPPILVRAGELVRVPVDVVCATQGGRACAARVVIGTREGVGPWRETGTVALPGLQFDLTAPVARTLARAPSGSVDFYLRAEAGPGAATSLPANAPTGSLRVYVTRNMPVVRVPSPSFGRVRDGRTVLYLPWGSGESKAGLAPGHESQTLGPPSFDVDRRGWIYVADALQQRLALFSGGRLVRAVRLPLGIRPDVTASGDGSAFIADRSGSRLSVRRVDAAGRPGPAVSMGSGILGQVRTVAMRVFVNVLPEDAWLPVRERSGSGATGSRTVGMPVAGGEQLLRAAREDRIRIGTVAPDGAVTDAVELRSAVRFGDLALAEPDGHGGYVVVVHVWRAGPTPADHYQVIHLVGTRVVQTFVVGDGLFAQTPPLSRFRLAPDGDLYQLTTSPDGMRIQRYDLKEES